jgi:muconolactone delta-isomerase
MKFLVIRKPRVGALVQPTSQTIRAQKEMLLGAVKRGEIDCTYAFVNGGGCSIANADSAEDLNQRLFSSPLGLFYEFDVHPLCDYSKFMDTIAQALETQEKQRK